MPKSLQIVVLVVAAIGALVTGVMLSQRMHFGDNQASGKPHVETSAAAATPDRFGEFELPDVSGEIKRTSNFAGRTLLVNFWATWCAPCREEIPVFSALAKTWKPRGLEVIGIALDETEAVRRFGDEVGLDYHSLVPGRDAGFAMLETYNPSGALPFSLLVGPDGKVLESKLGIWHASELEPLFERYLPAP